MRFTNVCDCCRTYRQEDVTPIKKEEDGNTRPRQMSIVAPGNQANSDDVVTEHLPVIFSALFEVDNNQLSAVESKCEEVIRFDGAGEWSVRVQCPVCVCVEKPASVWIHRSGHPLWNDLAMRKDCFESNSSTYQTEQPCYNIVHDCSGLFSESSGEAFELRDSLGLTFRPKTTGLDSNDVLFTIWGAPRPRTRPRTVPGGMSILGDRSSNTICLPDPIAQDVALFIQRRISR